MISMNKKYKTRDGSPVRIYCTDAGGDYPVHGSISLGEDGFVVESWTSSGSICADEEHDDRDLIEVKEPKRFVRWVNMYKDIRNRSYQHETKQEALDMMALGCIGTICIELLIHDDGRKEARIIEVV